MCVYVKTNKKSHQIYKHTHVLFGQPVEQSCWISGKDLIIVESGDGLDTLLELLQTRFHTLYLIQHINRDHVLVCASNLSIVSNHQHETGCNKHIIHQSPLLTTVTILKRTAIVNLHSKPFISSASKLSLLVAL